VVVCVIICSEDLPSVVHHTIGMQASSRVRAMVKVKVKVEAKVRG
jgi:hypothetical protein